MDISRARSILIDKYLALRDIKTQRIIAMSSDHSEKQRLLNAVHAAGSGYGARFILVHQAVADRLGLNVIDLRCLRLAGEAVEPTAGHLAKITGLTTGTITGLLDRLEKAGFIRRERDPEDRRKVIVKVLPSGIQKVERIMAPLSGDMNKVLEEFTEDELRAVVKFFEVTAAAVSRHVERIHKERPAKRKPSRHPAQPR
jgi:DNA-binding MarR family transcriptional regulator